MKEFIKKYNIYFLFIPAILIIINNSFSHVILPLDELWNFQFVYKMYNGFTIYKDATVVTTPLFFMIGNILFHIFGATINVFRLYNVFTYLLVYLLIFFIFRKLDINKNLAFLYLVSILTQTYGIIGGGTSYNALCIAFILLGILVHLNCYNQKRYNLYQGIIIFLIFFTKQSIGVFYAFGIVLFELVDKKFSKEFFVNQFKKFFCFLFPTILFCLFMYINGYFFDFVNYAFGGLLEFAHSNSSMHNRIFIFVFILVCICTLFIKTRKFLSEDQKRKTTFLFIMGMCASLINLPLMNLAHMSYSYLVIYLSFFYILDITLIKHIVNTDKHYNYCNLCSFIILILTLLYIFSQTYASLLHLNKFEKTHPFYNAPFSDRTIDGINVLTKYIERKNKYGFNVIIIAPDSGYIMIPLKQSNGAFDLVLRGNLGYKGVEKLIEQIEATKNTEFLMYTDDDKVFWQEPEEIREYIINNLDKQGEILHYSIYAK